MAKVSADITTYQMYINGQWVDAASGGTFDSYNPYTGTAWALIPDGQNQDLDRAVEAAARALDSNEWQRMPPMQRGHLLRRLADLISDNAEHLAQTETRDNGKLIREMLGQARAIPGYYYYYAGLADKILGETIPLENTSVFNYTLREPVGVVGIIIPWNSPLLILSFSLAAALAAGNAVVVKPSEHASASTLDFARLVQEAGFPPGVFNVVTGFGKTTGSALVGHPGINKIVFTGGAETGKIIARMAATNLTPLLLELGGKSPNIVFQDAVLPNAVNGSRIHRRTSLGTALEEASGCSSESGIMVLEQKPARKQGAPNRCCHRTNPTVSASSLTTIAWWPMPACACRPP